MASSCPRGSLAGTGSQDQVTRNPLHPWSLHVEPRLGTAAPSSPVSSRATAHASFGVWLVTNSSLQQDPLVPAQGRHRRHLLSLPTAGPVVAVEASCGWR